MRRHHGRQEVLISECDLWGRPPCPMCWTCSALGLKQKTIWWKREVRQTLHRVNLSVLKGCADQLADVLMDVFNISLSSATFPSCFETTTVVPVPKQSPVSCLNDLRPITPTIMKRSERLILRHMKNILPPQTPCSSVPITPLMTPSPPPST